MRGTAAINCRVYGCRPRRRFGRGALLDDPAGVHDRDPVREPAHDCQVVRHVQRRRALERRDPADGRQHVGLRRDVESRGRLVEDDDRRLARERHRDATRCCWPPDSWCGYRAGTRGRRAGRPRQHLGDALTADSDRSDPGVHVERLDQACADAQPGLRPARTCGT